MDYILVLNLVKEHAERIGNEAFGEATSVVRRYFEGKPPMNHWNTFQKELYQALSEKGSIS